jgi:hypothetical protein
VVGVAAVVPCPPTAPLGVLKPLDPSAAQRELVEELLGLGA